MLLVALGYNATNENFTGDSWSVNVNVRATQKGLYKGIEGIDTNAALTRDNAAQMIKNALDANMVSYNNEFTTGPNGQIIATPVLADKQAQNGGPITLLEDKYEAKTQEGILSGFSYDANKATWTYSFTVSSGTAVDVKSATDYTALLGQNVEAIYDNDTTKTVKDAYGIYASDSSVILSGVVGDLPDLDNTSDNSFKVSGTTYKLDDTVGTTNVVQFSGNMAAFPSASATLNDLAGKTGSPAADVETYDAQKFDAIDQDGNGKIDIFMVYPAFVDKITSISSTKVTLRDNGQKDIEDIDLYSGAARNDYVIYVAAANTAKDTATVTKADLVSGKITRVSGSNLTIDGTVYTKDASFTADTSVGSTLTDAVLMNGYVFNADVNAASANAEDYVLIASTVSTNYGDKSVRLLFSDGSKKTVDLDSDNTLEAKGTLCTYSTNSNGEYTLKAVTDKAGTVTKISGSSSKAGFIGGNTINDDSVIFVKYGASGDKFSVISGATMKTMAASDFAGTGATWYQNNTNSSTGVGSINVAYVTTATTVDSLAASDTFYGYVTGKANVTNDDGKEVTEVVLWTKDGEVTLNTTTGSVKNDSSIAKGNAISYKLNSDGEIREVADIATIAPLTAKTGTMVWLDGTAYDLTDDVIILGVDTTGPSGEVKDGTWESLSLAEKDNSDNWLNNIWYVLDDGDVSVIIYDINNETVS